MTRGTVIRPCLKCHEPLVLDVEILRDAARQGYPLRIVPLRCVHGHTERVELGPPERLRTRLVPTCGYCGEVVDEPRSQGGRGGQYKNHPACTRSGRHGKQTYPHRYVEVAV